MGEWWTCPTCAAVHQETAWVVWIGGDPRYACSAVCASREVWPKPGPRR